MNLLFEDDHLLVVNKPAGLVAMGHPQGNDLQQLAGQYLGSETAPGFAAMIGRLDAPVSGVVLFAKTRDAAQRLADKRLDKRYWAVVPAPVDGSGEIDGSGELGNSLVVDKRHRFVRVTDSHTEGAKPAHLRYQRLSQTDEMTLLEIALTTGRKHQIRVQLAHHFAPIVGDRKYGSELELQQGIALHAFQVRLQHPLDERSLEISAPMPAEWTTIPAMVELLAQRR